MKFAALVDCELQIKYAEKTVVRLKEKIESLEVELMIIDGQIEIENNYADAVIITEDGNECDD